MPERLRDIDYQTARFLLDKSNVSPLKKRMEAKKLAKAHREGRVGLSPQEPTQHRWWRCEARFRLGDYSDWSGWEYRDPWATRIWFDNPFPVPVWDTRPVDTLYVVGEQGIGDEVLFAQCLLEVPAKKIVLETQPKLIPVLSQIVECVPATLLPHPGGEGFIRKALPFTANAWVSLGDLPRLYRRKKEDFPRTPYLKAAGSLYEGRTGISWRGAQGYEPRILRAFPKALSLQYDQSWDEDIERPDIDLLNDMAGVMKVIQGLERVITVSTSIAHLSAAMGKETHVILAPMGTGRRGGVITWKWLNERCPGGTWWYSPNVRTYENWETFASSGMGRVLLKGAGAS